MTPAVPRRRAALYALLALALIGANAWRLAGREDDPERARARAEAEALADLPDLAATASLEGFAEPRPARDLFRREAPPDPEPEPEPPAPAARAAARPDRAGGRGGAPDARRHRPARPAGRRRERAGGGAWSTTARA